MACLRILKHDVVICYRLVEIVGFWLRQIFTAVDNLLQRILGNASSLLWNQAFALAWSFQNTVDFLLDSKTPRKKRGCRRVGESGIKANPMQIPAPSHCALPLLVFIPPTGVLRVVWQFLPVPSAWRVLQLPARTLPATPLISQLWRHRSHSSS
jgi:hypothetical protein